MNADDHLTQINNITDPDEFYEDLIQAHDGLSADQSRQLNSRIILLMANQIADNRKLTELNYFSENELGCNLARLFKYF